MENLYKDITINTNSIFDDSFIEAKSLYLQCFNALPSMHYIGCIDGPKAFDKIKEEFKDDIRNVYQTKWYDRKRKKYHFDRTIVVMNNCIIEIGKNYCDMLHDGNNDERIEALTAMVSQFRERQRKAPLEINLVVQVRNKLELKPMEIKPAKLDIGLFYEDDFKEVDALIQTRLKNKKDKGIVLLHGLPGTGKTSYLRYLVGKIKKRVLFLSPSVAGNLMNPDFIELLVDNPNTVLIIEDAENIIMDRQFNSSSSVSNLLNISDGLLADFLNVQLICTFNSHLSSVDQALMRKGRLIARYEFGKLGIKKAQALSDYLGLGVQVKVPMSLSELTNAESKEFDMKQVNPIGFRTMRKLVDAG